MTNAFDWADALANGLIQEYINETGILTPAEARAKAADLIAAARAADQAQGVHLPSADCWCHPDVEYVPPRQQTTT